MNGRDFHLGDLVAYPANRRGQERREAHGTVRGFRLSSNSTKLGGTDGKALGWVEVLGGDGLVRSFRRSEIRLVRAFDQ